MRNINVSFEPKESVTVAWVKGSKHRYYEDSFRMLSRDIPIVSQQTRGELFAVFDGIGSAPEGRRAAQEMADCLLKFYREPRLCPASLEGIEALLFEANMVINNRGFMPGTNMPNGGCAGTVAWLNADVLYVFHAGDTVALLIRDGVANQLTGVHQLEDGAIFRYFGMGETLNMEIQSFEIEESDRILLLSDGVTKVFTPLEAAGLVEEYMDISVAVKTLVQRSQAMGSTDDITAMLIQVEDIWEYE